MDGLFHGKSDLEMDDLRVPLFWETSSCYMLFGYLWLFCVYLPNADGFAEIEDIRMDTPLVSEKTTGPSAKSTPNAYDGLQEPCM